MRSRLVARMGLLFLLSALVHAQEKSTVYELKDKQGSVRLLNDPKSPIRLEGPKRMLRWKNGAVDLDYKIVNISKGNILKFEIRETNWFGNMEKVSEPTLTKGTFSPTIFIPGFIYDKNEVETIPLDLSRAEQLGLSKPADSVWMVTVPKVKFTDGRIFDSTSKYDRLKKFLEDLDNEAWDLEESGKKVDRVQYESKIRAFISKLDLRID